MMSWSRPFRPLRICLRHIRAGREHTGGRKIEGGNPFEGPRSREFPLPPLTNPPTSVLFAKATRDLGDTILTHSRRRTLHGPTRTLMAASSARATSAASAVISGCINYSKASPQTAILPSSSTECRTFAQRTNAHVLKVNTDSSGKQATGVTYVDAQGRDVEQPATMVILAAFHLHNVRLMLSVGNRRALRSGHRQGHGRTQFLLSSSE